MYENVSSDYDPPSRDIACLLLGSVEMPLQASTAPKYPAPVSRAPLRKGYGLDRITLSPFPYVLAALSSSHGPPMNPRPHGSSNIQWINRKDMNARTEDGISLCQRALQIVTELCLAGHVDREKCADIFPLESNIPGKGSSGKFKLIEVYSSFAHILLPFPRTLVLQVNE